MFSQWVFLSVLALAVPSFAWAEDAVSDLAREQSKAEQGDKRGDELFAEFTRLRQAAETGEPQALFDFGAYFYQQQNYASAREWWGKAAAAGMVRAQIQLAMLYRDGDGGPQDKTEAARWFRKAAEQGDAAAQNEMGVLYWRGEGVDQDRVKAGTWFERAAASGSEDAETNLGWFYLDDSQGVYSATSDEGRPAGPLCRQPGKGLPVVLQGCDPGRCPCPVQGGRGLLERFRCRDEQAASAALAGKGRTAAGCGCHRLVGERRERSLVHPPGKLDSRCAGWRAVRRRRLLRCRRSPALRPRHGGRPV